MDKLQEFLNAKNEINQILDIYRQEINKTKKINNDTVELIDDYILNEIINNKYSDSMLNVDFYVYKNGDKNIVDINNFLNSRYKNLKIKYDSKYFNYEYNYPYISFNIKEEFKYLPFFEDLRRTKNKLIDNDYQVYKDENDYCNKLFDYFEKSKYKDYLEYKKYEIKKQKPNPGIRIMVRQPASPPKCSLFVHKYNKEERELYNEHCL